MGKQNKNPKSSMMPISRNKNVKDLQRVPHIQGNINSPIIIEQKTSGNINCGSQGLYTSAQSVREKEEGRQVLLWEGDYDLKGITETCGMTFTIGILGLRGIICLKGTDK